MFAHNLAEAAKKLQHSILNSKENLQQLKESIALVERELQDTARLVGYVRIKTDELQHLANPPTSESMMLSDVHGILKEEFNRSPLPMPEIKHNMGHLCSTSVGSFDSANY